MGLQIQMDSQQGRTPIQENSSPTFSLARLYLLRECCCWPAGRRFLQLRLLTLAARCSSCTCRVGAWH